MLVISLVAMITGCALLYLDLSQYPEKPPAAAAHLKVTLRHAARLALTCSSAKRLRDAARRRFSMHTAFPRPDCLHIYIKS